MIELILGSMKSGKSRMLFRHIDIAAYSKKPDGSPIKTCLVRPGVDTREFVSRSQKEELSYDLLVFEKLDDHIEELAEYDVVCIDEGQFFPDLESGTFTLSNLGKSVYIACLQGDRNMKPWKPVSEVLPIADKITQVQAVCVFCGDNRKSTFTYYDGPPSEDQIVIGDGDFHPACFDCWVHKTRGVRF